MTVYLIDGYNVLHQFLGHHPRSGRSEGAPGRKGRVGAGAQGRPEHATPVQDEERGATAFGLSDADFERERRRLLDRIASYMGLTSDRAIVVFDARSQALQKIESATRNMEVRFGSFAQSADDIIEREVYALSAGETVVVVSSDYPLQKTVFISNVTRLSSRQFIAHLQEHTRRIANSKNCTTIAHRIEERLDAETAAKLRALRDQPPVEQGELDRPREGSED